MQNHLPSNKKKGVQITSLLFIQEVESIEDALIPYIFTCTRLTTRAPPRGPKYDGEEKMNNV